jgi:hypothetical protein
MEELWLKKQKCLLLINMFSAKESGRRTGRPLRGKSRTYCFLQNAGNAARSCFSPYNSAFHIKKPPERAALLSTDG